MLKLNLPGTLFKIASDEQLGRAVRLRTHTDRKKRNKMNQSIHKNDSHYKKEGTFDPKLERLLTKAEEKIKKDVPS